jgi:hypothetical protein
MAMIRPFAWLAALVAALGLAASASAQYYQPFIDPGYFEPDFQFFAPAEVDDFGGRQPPNTGVYFDYDRTYVNMSRPVDEPSLFSPFEGDFTWGNRYEIGYMTEEKAGWQAVLLHINGPNEFIGVFQERLDRFNDDDDPPDAPDPIFQDRNPRSYIIRTSLNVASLSSFELNKVWRRKEFHNGGVLEPLVGFRYMNYRDRYIRDDYQRFAEDAAGEPVPIPNTVDGVFEQLDTHSAFFENKMFGGQLGLRFFNQRGHWLLSTEVRFFACANFQQLETVDSTRLTRYTAVGGDPELELNESLGLDPDVQSVHQFFDADEFVWGGEVRAEAAYELTRDISLRFGMVFLDLGTGIGRGNNLLFNDQDVQISGLTFGLTVNR